MSRRLLRLVAATSTLALLAGAASAQTPVRRANPAAGAIVAAKGLGTDSPVPNAFNPAYTFKKTVGIVTDLKIVDGDLQP